jgi:deazaflavin-dependent oxidoreductase (nitroreductase family)
MTTWLDEHADDDCCDLTTTGRRTGKAHEIEIWFGVIDATMYFISGNGPNADWYRNALANPSVSVRLAGAVHRGVARAVTDAEERRRVGDLMGAKYQWDGDDSIGLTYHAWCYDVPVLAVEGWDG